MDQKDYFQLGAKLIGLYSLILALPVLLGILPTLIAVTRNSTKVSEQFGVQHLPCCRPHLIGNPWILFAKESDLC